VPACRREGCHALAPKAVPGISFATARAFFADGQRQSVAGVAVARRAKLPGQDSVLQAERVGAAPDKVPLRDHVREPSLQQRLCGPPDRRVARQTQHLATNHDGEHLRIRQFRRWPALPHQPQFLVVHGTISGGLSPVTIAASDTLSKPEQKAPQPLESGATHRCTGGFAGGSTRCPDDCRRRPPYTGQFQRNFPGVSSGRSTIPMLCWANGDYQDSRDGNAARELFRGGISAADKAGIPWMPERCNSRAFRFGQLGHAKLLPGCRKTRGSGLDKAGRSLVQALKEAHRCNQATLLAVRTVRHPNPSEFPRSRLAGPCHPGWRTCQPGISGRSGPTECQRRGMPLATAHRQWLPEFPTGSSHRTGPDRRWQLAYPGQSAIPLAHLSGRSGGS